MVTALIPNFPKCIVTCTLQFAQAARHQGCQIFYVAYGRNSNEKWPKRLFFEKIMVKNTKCFKTMVIYIGDSKR